MLAYDENVTIWDEDDNMVGRCRMLGWVSVSVGGAKRWKGEILPVPGQPFDFELRSIEKSGLRLQCEDGAMAKILAPIVSDALSSGLRCTFEGIWPPPRPFDW